MKINTSDKLVAWLTLLSGLSISAVAVWYSVAGLVSIFAAAAVPIMIMGVALEVSKLVATVWLKMNWKIAPKLIRTYLIIAITILMMITSMGIFGFLSKAHLDQAVPTGDVADKVALIDEKIKTERDNIEAARKALKQMDEPVDQTMARSTDEKGADKAAALRRGQQRERTNLQNDIAKAQKHIAALNEERAPIAKDLRKIEAEVGPIKYIAALLYGDNPDSNVLEKAVRAVIIIIVIVFDPLAVILLLASQYSFMWFRQRNDDEAAMAINPTPAPGVTERPFTEEEIKSLDNHEEGEEEIDRHAYLKKPWVWKVPGVEPVGPLVYRPEEDTLPEAEEKHLASIDKAAQNSIIKREDSQPTANEEKRALEEWNKMIAEAEKAVDEEKELEDHEILESALESEKAAMKAWKHDNPDSSLKLQRRLLENGVIKKLPWEDYLKAQPDFSDNDAAEEAAKWALEQVEKKKQELDERPGDYIKENDVTWMEHDEQGNQIKKTKDNYQQNAEQSESTIWQRIKDAKK